MFLTEILLILNYFEKNVQKFQIFETVVNLLPEENKQIRIQKRHSNLCHPPDKFSVLPTSSMEVVERLLEIRLYEKISSFFNCIQLI